MDTLLRLMIADDEPYICGMLEKLIDFSDLGIELVGCANDGETLERNICQLQPDIVLTDISMPRLDGLDVIRSIREKGLDCRFVVISGYRQFEYAYNALKYNVDDFLLKPVEKGELNRVLRKLCQEFRKNDVSIQEEPRQHHDYLLRQGIRKELRSDGLSLEEINRSYNCSFRQGSFRMLKLKLDVLREGNQLGEDISSVLRKLHSLVVSRLPSCCFEVICTIGRDHILALANYPKEEERHFQKKIYEIHTQAKHVVELFQGISLTVCVGRPVERLCYAALTEKSCQRAVWLRLRYGLNQVIFEDTVEDVRLGGYASHLDAIWKNLERSYTSMDSEAAAISWKQFFLMPLAVIYGTEGMQFLSRNLECLYERYMLVTKNATNGEGIMAALEERLACQTTLAAFERVLVEQIGKLLDTMSEFVRDKNARPVLRAVAYIEAHYAQHITLETLAELVNLNPIYFSNLFKREMGKGFTEYLTTFRMKKAKELLRENHANINEIADALGYSDARYFSKVFKKEVGVKPTDYRKIYG